MTARKAPPRELKLLPGTPARKRKFEAAILRLGLDVVYHETIHPDTGERFRHITAKTPDDVPLLAHALADQLA